MVDDYIAIARTARSKHGERCLVFMQVGSFYEVYDVCDAEESIQLGVCEQLLYLKVTPKKMTCAIDGTPQPVFFAGIPIDALPRYRAMLIERHFTVFVIAQDDHDSSNRRLTQVASPGFDDPQPAP